MEVKYVSTDGKEFSTKEDCVDWETLPRIWIIEQWDCEYYDKVYCFIDEDTAKQELKRLKTMDKSVYDYVLKPCVLNLDVNNTVHQKLTNKETTKPSWFSKLKGLVKRHATT